MRFNESNVSDLGVGGVRIGDRIRWTSAIGITRGEVVGMRLALNANATLVPWIMIEWLDGVRGMKRTELCGIEDNLKMLQFRVNFRDNFRTNEVA
jgi:hypothetical protein